MISTCGHGPRLSERFTHLVASIEALTNRRSNEDQSNLTKEHDGKYHWNVITIKVDTRLAM